MWEEIEGGYNIIVPSNPLASPTPGVGILLTPELMGVAVEVLLEL